MKFKVLFILFNIVLFLSFFTIFLLPFFVLDGGFMVEFWTKNWFFGLVFLAILGIVNGAFLANWKLLSCLEREDWPGLAAHLEREVIEKKRYGRRKVRLLCDSLLLLGDFATIRKLAAALRADKPSAFAPLATRFAAAELLAADYEALYAITSEFAGAKCADRDWLAFYGAFSRHLALRYGDAANGMLPLARDSSDPIVTLLSGYVCDKLLPLKVSDRTDELVAAARDARERLLGKFTRSQWLSYLETAKSEMHVVILAKLIDEATVSLFPASAPSGSLASARKA